MNYTDEQIQKAFDRACLATPAMRISLSNWKKDWREEKAQRLSIAKAFLAALPAPSAEPEQPSELDLLRNIWGRLSIAVDEIDHKGNNTTPDDVLARLAVFKAPDGNSTLPFFVTPKEAEAIQELMQLQDMSQNAVLRQALRHCQQDVLRRHGIAKELPPKAQEAEQTKPDEKPCGLNSALEAWPAPDEPAQAKAAPTEAAEAKCVCGEPTVPGVIHRQDGPCYHDQPQPPMIRLRLPSEKPTRKDGDKDGEIGTYGPEGINFCKWDSDISDVHFWLPGSLPDGVLLREPTQEEKWQAEFEKCFPDFDLIKQKDGGYLHAHAAVVWRAFLAAKKGGAK